MRHNLKGILVIAILALIICSCEKHEKKPGALSATPEEELAAQAKRSAKVTTVAKTRQASQQNLLPPMATVQPVYPQALAQRLQTPEVSQENKPAFKTFYVYADSKSKNNHFIPSGWMGDVSDIALLTDSTENPQSGSTCIKITYSNKATEGAQWAGIYWQDPANNWGAEATGGFDLTGAKTLSFWVRGENGGERIEEFKMGGIQGAYSDSDTTTMGPLLLTKQWKKYTFNLAGKNLKHIIGGFAWSTNLIANPKGCVFYLDEIKYE